MRRKLFLLSLLLAGPAWGRLKVVTTVTDLGGIARAVGGKHVDVVVLANPGQDPHFVDAKPSLVLDLARADAVMLLGMDLEVGWLPTLLTASRNSKIQLGAGGYIDCSVFIAPREIPAHKVDRSMGDIHPGGNPHYSRDPRNAVLLARGMAQRLAKLDPEHAEAFAAAATVFNKGLTEKAAQWKKQLAPYQGEGVVTYHKSWGYFLDWAGLSEVGFIEPKPGIPPNPSSVAELLSLMKAKKVQLILQETWYPAATAQLLSGHSGAKLVRVPGSPARDQGYVEYWEGIVSEFVKGLNSMNERTNP